MEKPKFEDLPQLISDLIIEIQSIKSILLHKPNYESDEFLNKKIEYTGLSVRAIRALRGAELSFVYEIINYSKTDLIKFRNMGKKSLDEIDSLLILHGLSLKK